MSAIGGGVVLVLELPTSSFSDGFGRRPVYLAAAIVNVSAACVYPVADTFWMFAVGACLMGTFRALDSGPLEAWYVDTVHLSDPGADVDAALARQGVVLGTAVASGALVSGGLVWWHPLTAMSALTLPIAVFAVLNVVHLLAVVILMREPLGAAAAGGARRALRSVRQAPDVVLDGLVLLRGNRVLRGLVLVEVFWSIAMVVFEQFQPIRLGELLGDEARAGTWMGPVAASGWAVFALGAGLAGHTSRRIGVAWGRHSRPTPQQPRCDHHGPRGRTDRSGRCLPGHLRDARRCRPDARRPPSPRSLKAQPSHPPVDELDDRLRSLRAHRATPRPPSRLHLQPDSHGDCRDHQPGRRGLLPARPA
ncbi:MFS transporter [Nocardioides sp. B-3]|uniref:MFS transporter n=1 Tax=Nocardioides sp. B-3 TaxID=2895565 RepID=UPI002152288F|nr:MFS transporter [Nocardioides sp. B-3]UUZ59915.1 MFS transporter [Nocardioides sp. B-3]